MKRINSLLLSSIVYAGMLVAYPVQAKTPGPITSHSKSEQHVINHNGMDRTYSIYVPDGIQRSQSLPLLIALHGGGGSANKWPVYTNNGFESLADREHFILVYPNGMEAHWNDGRGVDRFYSHREDIDDTGFLNRLIEDLTNTYPIDTNRIYVTGASNGGMLAHRLAAEYSNKVAAIATVISSIPQNLAGKLHPTHPVSVLMINGTDDPLVRWEGGPIKFGKKYNGDVISTDQTVNFWVNHNRCKPSAETDDLPDIASDDGTRVKRISYPNCKAGSAVVLYKIIGGGHAWPAHQVKRQPIRKLIIDKLVGKKSRDIDACEVIWQFFRDHPRSD